jgi:hypothetical protein
MLVPTVRLMNEYKPLLVKMHLDANVRKPKELGVKCFSGLRDVQIIIGLASLMPMLQLANKLIKYSQGNEVFVCDYLAAVKQLQTNLAKHYVDSKSKYSQEDFWDLNALCEARHDVILMNWVTEDLDLNASGVEFLSFEPKDYNIPTCFNP